MADRGAIATVEPGGGRFSRLPTTAVFDNRVSAACLRVLAALGSYADSEGYCFPGTETLADRLYISRRMVQRHLRRLEHLGYLDTQGQHRLADGGWSTNSYHLLYPAAPPPLRAVVRKRPHAGGHFEPRRPKSASGQITGKKPRATPDVAPDRQTAERLESPVRHIGPPPCDVDGTNAATFNVALTSSTNSPIRTAQEDARQVEEKDSEKALAGLRRIPRSLSPADRKIRWRQSVMAYMAEQIADTREKEAAFATILNDPDGPEAGELLNIWDKVRRQSIESRCAQSR